MSRLTDIVGVWDASETDEDGDYDEIYWVVDADGFVSTYDYDDDDWGDGKNCYDIYKDQAQLQHISGNLFKMTSDDEDDVDVRFSFVSDNLTVSGVDDDGDDFTETIGPRAGASYTVENFEAIECADD
ncbi:MAG: hypothetical protein JXQ97_12745 [Natronospirillum sp.]